MLHRCTDAECPHLGQRTNNGCGCHRTDEQVLTDALTEARVIIEQIESDVRWPPAPDSIERRIERANAWLDRADRILGVPA